jgi:hypothetical protein
MWFWKHSLSPLVGRLATSRQFALAPPRTALDELVTVGVAAGLGVVMPFIVRNGWPKAPPPGLQRRSVWRLYKVFWTECSPLLAQYVASCK